MNEANGLGPDLPHERVTPLLDRGGRAGGNAARMAAAARRGAVSVVPDHREEYRDELTDPEPHATFHREIEVWRQRAINESTESCLDKLRWGRPRARQRRRGKDLGTRPPGPVPATLPALPPAW